MDSPSEIVTRLRRDADYADKMGNARDGEWYRLLAATIEQLEKLVKMLDRADMLDRPAYQALVKRAESAEAALAQARGETARLRREVLIASNNLCIWADRREGSARVFARNLGTRLFRAVHVGDTAPPAPAAAGRLGTLGEGQV